MIENAMCADSQALNSLRTRSWNWIEYCRSAAADASGSSSALALGVPATPAVGPYA